MSRQRGLNKVSPPKGIAILNCVHINRNTKYVMTNSMNLKEEERKVQVQTVTSASYLTSNGITRPDVRGYRRIQNTARPRLI